MKSSLKTVITELEDLFEVFNEKYFDSELSRPVITVSPNHKTSAFGWCTGWKAWKEKDGGEGYYEINICAEYLSGPFNEVAATMLHEMVHLWNIENGIQDTSRGGTYHNKEFKTTAELHGLTVEKDEKYGWCKTDLNPEALEETNNYMDFIGKDSFDIYRESEPTEEPKEKKKGGNSIKYVCPMCGAIIRATKKVRVICAECDVEFTEE